MDYFLLLLSSFVPFLSSPLFHIWTTLCLLIHVDPPCTIVTHPRIPVLGPEGCTMTHGLIPWLTLFVYVCYDKDLHDRFLFILLGVLILESQWLTLYLSTGLWPYLSWWLMRSSLLWLRAAPHCTSLHTVTYCCSDAIVLLLYIAAHCDLLLQWRYCSLTVHCCALWPIVAVTLLFSYCTSLRTVTYCCSDAIVLLQYISQACWVLCSPRLDFFHHTVISTLVAANRLRSPLPLCLIPLKVIHCNVLKWHALVNYFSPETI